jgi:hypothetical protein
VPTNNEFSLPLMLEVEPEPKSADELYAAYRKSFITRHICLNGRVDQYTWLRQVDEYCTAPTRLFKNQRGRMENFIHPQTGDNCEESFHWLPMQFEPSDRSVVPDGWGGGDNPLLHGGLALATFSMETLLGVTSDSSILYAHQLFRFLLSSEVPGRGGMLLRRNSVGKEVALASTDEILGVCVGLLFYVRALERVGDLAHADQARSYIRRIADCINAHGFWILPFADDLALLRAEGVLKGELPMSRQTGFVFAYPLSLFFSAVLAANCPRMSCQWDEDEFNRYFPEWLIDGGNISNARWMAIAKAVEEAEPDAWDYARNATLGAVVGAALGGPIGAGVGALVGLGATASVDVNLEWDNHGFFVNLLKLAVNQFEDDGSIPYQALRTVLDPIDSPLADKVAEELAERIDAALIDSPFNLHLLALATILAFEAGASKREEVTAVAGQAFEALLKSYTVTVGSCRVQMGEKNGLFAVIAKYCSPNSDYSDALSIFVSNNGPKTFQHDLPLSVFPVLALLAQQPGNEDVGPSPGHVMVNARHCALNRLRGLISRHLGSDAEKWWEDYRKACPPSDFNPARQWGTGSTWETMTWPDDCSAYEFPCHIFYKGQYFGNDGEIAFRPEGMDVSRFAKAMTDPRIRGKAMNVEGDGLDLLFPRMLGAYWGVLAAPQLAVSEREKLWPTLPYLGANPWNWHLGGFHAAVVDENHCLAGSFPQKNLTTLRRRGESTAVPIMGKKGKFLYSGKLMWGGEATILNETFRGARMHRYLEVLPALTVDVQWAHGDWDFYVELGSSKSRLAKTPTWKPTAATVHDPSNHLIRFAVQKGRPGKHRLPDADIGNLVATLDSSIYFWSIHARLEINESVGNEAIEVVIPCSQAHWIRMNRLPTSESRCELVFNPHQGTIHMVAVSDPRHLQGAVDAFNILWLPIRRADLEDKGDVKTSVANLLLSGEMSSEEDLSLWLPRRDAYKDLPRRLLEYNQRHPDRATRYIELNTRQIRYCSHCFKGLRH